MAKMEAIKLKLVLTNEINKLVQKYNIDIEALDVKIYTKKQKDETKNTLAGSILIKFISNTTIENYTPFESELDDELLEEDYIEGKLLAQTVKSDVKS